MDGIQPCVTFPVSLSSRSVSRMSAKGHFLIPFFTPLKGNIFFRVSESNQCYNKSSRIKGSSKMAEAQPSFTLLLTPAIHKNVCHFAVHIIDTVLSSPSLLREFGLLEKVNIWNAFHMSTCVCSYVLCVLYAICAWECVCPCEQRRSFGALLYLSLAIPLREGFSLRLELRWQPSNPSCLLFLPLPLNTGVIGMHTATASFLHWVLEI